MFKHKGNIHRIGELRTVGNNGFQVLEIVLTQDDEYNPLIPMQLIGKNVNLVEQLGMMEGDTITVKFSIGGRELDNGKIFSNNTIAFIEQE